MKTNLSYQDFTTKIIVLIKGESREAIEQDFWGFYNHNGTDGGQAKADEPHLEWLTDNPAHGGYFYTTRERLLQSMVSRSLFKLLNDQQSQPRESNCFKGCEGGAMPYAKELGQQWFDSMKKITDVIKQRVDVGDPDNFGTFALGTISAEKPDKNS